jgi:hypothetical protein
VYSHEQRVYELFKGGGVDRTTIDIQGSRSSSATSFRVLTRAVNL